jgi:hypothetical protein
MESVVSLVLELDVVEDVDVAVVVDDCSRASRTFDTRELMLLMLDMGRAPQVSGGLCGIFASSRGRAGRGDSPVR